MGLKLSIFNLLLIIFIVISECSMLNAKRRGLNMCEFRIRVQKLLVKILRYDYGLWSYNLVSDVIK